MSDDVFIELPGVEVEPLGSLGGGHVVDPPHLMWPLRYAPGRMQTVAQDSLDDVRQCVNVLMVTPLGCRPLAPLIGVEDPTFTSGGFDADRLASGLEDMEDRASVTVTVVGPDPQGMQRTRIEVSLAEDADTEEQQQ